MTAADIANELGCSASHVRDLIRGIRKAQKAGHITTDADRTEELAGGRDALRRSDNLQLPSLDKREAAREWFEANKGAS